jgi:hypothetical protein
MYFPSYNHDDIFDAIADQMTNADGEVVSDVIPTQKLAANELHPKFLGFGAEGRAIFDIATEDWDRAVPNVDPKMTGF